MTIKKIDLEFINIAFEYNQITGQITNKIKRSSRVKVGKEAGSKDARGYRQIKINGENYLSHRIAWAIYYGEQPPKVIDHIDGDGTNNAIVNLRASSPVLNMQNLRKPRSDNQCGFLGVRKLRGKYTATIVVNKKQIHLGSFDTPEEASSIYMSEKINLHEGF